ncbi:homeobox-leucine zipper protein HAT4-like [Wolffia australiana]
MTEGDDLTLSLGLGRLSRQLHIHRSSASSSSPESTGTGNKWIDMNQAPAVSGTRDGEEEDGAGGCSPNSAGSSVLSGGGKRAEGDRRPHNGEESEPACAFARGTSDEEDGSEGSRKKLRLSKEQSAVLEDSFREHNTLNPKQKLALAKQLNLRPRQVEVWFQNRRARTKLKQTEVDCEFLKRRCESLTEENRRLHKEVQELRMLKLSPQLYAQTPPPATLTMCPSCERLAASATDRKPHRHILPRPANAPPLPWPPAKLLP